MQLERLVLSLLVYCRCPKARLLVSLSLLHARERTKMNATILRTFSWHETQVSIDLPINLLKPLERPSSVRRDYLNLSLLSLFLSLSPRPLSPCSTEIHAVFVRFPHIDNVSALWLPSSSSANGALPDHCPVLHFCTHCSCQST